MVSKYINIREASATRADHKAPGSLHSCYCLQIQFGEKCRKWMLFSITDLSELIPNLKGCKMSELSPK